MTVCIIRRVLVEAPIFAAEDLEMLRKEYPVLREYYDVALAHFNSGTALSAVTAEYVLRDISEALIEGPVALRELNKDPAVSFLEGFEDFAIIPLYLLIGKVDKGETQELTSPFSPSFWLVDKLIKLWNRTKK